MSPTVKVTKFLHIQDLSCYPQQPDQAGFLLTTMVIIYVLITVSFILLWDAATPHAWVLADMNNQSRYSRLLSLRLLLHLAQKAVATNQLTLA